MELNKLNQLYREVVLDHAEHPRHQGTVSDANCQMSMDNPTCGDELTVTIKVSPDQVIKAIAFEGTGCTISQASASMMTSAVQDKTVDEALELAQIFSDAAIGKTVSKDQLNRLGDAQLLTSVMEFPARIKCATLAWWTLQRALLKESD
ncbi:Fe-S cluster assembly sulfur transfer protein SufU [Limosilactobacillus gastricus]|uniref:Fe-S cluster assembly sulfur transfer protein SufU n=1 Tax=Limosilactobacillus gastricus TaxID=227942 RepID=UPI0026F18B0F|nr:SUF system NifU family Fe-S cluster assembly protein [Limosilactobacillus gastricus]